MSHSAILSNMSRGWARRPEGTITGSADDSPSAALWTARDGATVEVSAEPDANQHIIGFQLNEFSSESWVDDRLFFYGQHQRGTCNIIRAGETPRSVIKGPFKILHFYMPKAVVEELAEQAFGGGGSSLVEIIDPGCDYSSSLWRIASEILDELRTDRILSRLRIDLLGQEAALALLRDHSNRSKGTPFAIRDTARCDWRIRRTISQLEDRLADDPGLSALAAEVDLKPRQYASLFRAATGLPPHAWLMKRRVERACELLRDTNRSITDVAAELGFASSQHFATVFNRRMGTAPTAYRREMAR